MLERTLEISLLVKKPKHRKIKWLGWGQSNLVAEPPIYEALEVPFF